MTDALWIDNKHALLRFLAQIEHAPAVAIDTEFHREDHYRPRLALVQIFDGRACALIDPLAVELAPLWQALKRHRGIKVLHAARQDCEIFWHEARFIPQPLFDTQIAAALVGFGAQIGLAELVQRLLGHTIAKHASFTNWLVRPLSPEQLHYAQEDVRWLLPLYERLSGELKKRGRYEWLFEEQRFLLDPGLYEQPISEAWRRVKGASRLKGKALARLQALAAWREKTAASLDLPRRRVLADETLITLAKRDTLDERVLHALRGSAGQQARRFAAEILAAWRAGDVLAPEQWPKRAPSPARSAGTQQRKLLLDALVRLRAESCQVASSILAPKEELLELASWGAHPNARKPDLRILSGWRRAIIGEELLRLLRGEIALAIDSKTHRPKTIVCKEQQA